MEGRYNLRDVAFREEGLFEDDEFVDRIIPALISQYSKAILEHKASLTLAVSQNEGIQHVNQHETDLFDLFAFDDDLSSTSVNRDYDDTDNYDDHADQSDYSDTE
jgi:hypothetical protein